MSEFDSTVLLIIEGMLGKKTREGLPRKHIGLALAARHSQKFAAMCRIDFYFKALIRPPVSHLPVLVEKAVR